MTSSSARSQSCDTALTRAIALSGCEGFWTWRNVALATTWAPVSSKPGPITTAEPVLLEGVRACHGPSKSGSWDVAKTRMTSGYATPDRSVGATLSLGSAMLALQALTPHALAASVPAVTLAEARKLIAQVHRGEPIAATSAVSRRAADAVRAACELPALRVVSEVASAIDPFVKYLVEAGDGARFEAVRIPLEVAGRFSACVSSQVGCALGCTFCATGRLGLARNLESWEIVEQVRVIRSRLGPRGSAFGRVHGVVFQAKSCSPTPMR